MSDQKLEILVRTVFEQVGKPFGKEDIERVVGSLKSAAPAAAAAGAHVGEEAGAGMSHALEHHLKVHVANMISGVLGAPGLGRLAALGASGIAGAAAFAVTEKVGEQIGEFLKEIKEEHQELDKLGKVLRETGNAHGEYLEHLHDIAERTHVAGVATKDWIESFKELHLHGANPENITPYTHALKLLSEMMSGDAKGATKVLTAAVDGNTQSLHEFGIVVNGAMKQEELLAEITRQLEIRTASFGESAVAAGPQVRALKEAGESAAEGLAAIKREAEEADEALTRLLKHLSEANQGRHKDADDAADQKTAGVQKDFAEGKINAAQRDDRLAAIDKEKRSKKFESDKNTFTAEKALHEERAQQAQKEIEDRRAEGDAARDALARATAQENAEQELKRSEAAAEEVGKKSHPRGYVAPQHPQADLEEARARAEEARRNNPLGFTSAQANKTLEELYGPDGKKMEQANDKARATKRKEIEAANEADAKLRDLGEHHSAEDATKQIQEQTKRIELRKQLQKQYEEFQKSAARGAANGTGVEMPDELKPFMQGGQFHPPDLLPESPTPKPRPRRPVFQYPADFDPGESEFVPKNEEWNRTQRQLRDRNMNRDFQRDSAPQEHIDHEKVAEAVAGPVGDMTEKLVGAIEKRFQGLDRNISDLTERLNYQRPV